MPAAGGRRLFVIVGVVVVVVLTLVAAFVLLRDDSRRADLGPPDESRPDRAAATTELLFQLQTALAASAGSDGSDDTLEALADPDIGSAGRELAAVAANVRDLRIDRLSLRYLDTAAVELSTAQQQRFGSDAWVSEVQLSWRFRGTDPGVSTLEVPVVADWQDGRAVFVTSRVTRGYRVPLWFTESLVVRRGPATLVLADDPQQARSLARQARTAVTTVRRTLPDFDDVLVVEAPGSVGAFRTAAGVNRTTSRSIAAVTTATDGSLIEGAPVHVYLNPDVFDPLGPVARQIVLSHEATHVALGATVTNTPLWLSEGIADHLALVDTSLPDAVLAAQIRQLVRDQGTPRQLPGQPEFNGSNRDIGAWYEAAWIAVRLISRTYGEQALLDFYERVEVDGDTRTAFREVLGTDEGAFVQRWRASLEELAR
jgi:hypothetical protein